MSPLSPQVRSRLLPTYALVFLLSALLLVLEIGLTRIFSALLFYHFAFMAISLALFGLSLGGLVVHFRRPWRLPFQRPGPLTQGIAWLAVIFAVTTVVAFLIYSRIRVPFDAGLSPSFWPLLFMFLAAAAPFLAVGTALALAFDQLAQSAGRLYAWNLAGSAAGCILVIPILNRLGAVQLVFLVAALALTGAWAVLRRGIGRHVTAALLVIIVALMFGQHRYGMVVIGSWKDPAWGPHMDRAEQGDPSSDFQLAWSGWNSYSKVAIYSSRKKLPPSSWGPSRPGAFPPVDQMVLVIDNLAGTMITGFDGQDMSGLEYLHYDVTASPYLLVERPETLIIGSGGGRDVLTALSAGAPRAVAVELNPLVVKPLQNEFADYTGRIYAGHPQVEVVIDEGRSFVRRDRRQYDLLQISLIDTWAATAAGAYSLSENTLYTVEAVKDYLERLRPEGVLSISRFVTDPPQQGLRVVSLYRQAAEELGLEPFSDHVIVTAVGAIATCMMRKTPFTPEEVGRFEEKARRRDFPILYAPGLPAPPIPLAGVYRELIKTDDFAGFLAGYDFDVSPCRDDRPFFFHMVKPGDAFLAPRHAGGQEFNQGAVTALLTLLLVVVTLSLFFILVPLALRSWLRPGQTAAKARPAAAIASAPLPSWAWILYFGTLGIGFMLFEIPLLQRLVHFLGHPVFATSVILFSLLLAAGLGSWWSQRLRSDRLSTHLVLATIGIALSSIWIGWVLPGWFEAWIHLPLAGRILVTVAVVAPVGFVLGLFFPLGMRALSGESDNLVAWMWGWNGSTSVLGSVVAVVLAMHIGFRATFALAAILYLVGVLIFAVSWRRAAARGREPV